MEFDVRRVVTGHDEAGNAVILQDGSAPPSPIGFQIWSTTKSPADNADSIDGGKAKVGLVSSQGSVFRMMRLEPGHHSPMHRSHSLDYGLVLAGELELELDNDVRTTLRVGDIVVQRGTVHAWHNNGDVDCIVAFILLGADPVVINGNALPVEVDGRAIPIDVPETAPEAPIGL